MDLITVHGRRPPDCTEDNCLRSGWTLPEFVAQCVLWALASLIYTYACSKVLPTRDFNGSPLYNWLSCLPVQLIAFPAVAAWCVAAYDGSFIEWLSAPWSQLAATPERVFLLLIYAYMFKDLGLYLLDTYRLERFVYEAHTQSARNSETCRDLNPTPPNHRFSKEARKHTLPLVLASKNPEAETYLVVGLWLNGRRDEGRWADASVFVLTVTDGEGSRLNAELGGIMVNPLGTVANQDGDLAGGYRASGNILDQK